MRRTISRIAVVVVTSLAMFSFTPARGSADPPAPLTMVVHVALAGNLQASTTHGGFQASVGVSDTGSEAGAGWFAGLGHLRTGEPNSLHATMTLVGTNGTIDVQLTGLFGTLPAATATGSGEWVVTGGSDVYADLHARGSWTATADFTAAMAGTGPPRVTFTLAGTAN